MIGIHWSFVKMTFGSFFINLSSLTFFWISKLIVTLLPSTYYCLDKLSFFINLYVWKYNYFLHWNFKQKSWFMFFSSMELNSYQDIKENDRFSSIFPT